MKLIAVIIIAVVIIVASILRAFSKFVEAGGSITKSLSELQRPDSSILSKNNEHNKSTSQSYRTLAGILFGILLLYPLVILGDKPIVDINPKLRLILLVSLISLELVIFITIWLKDRKW